VPIVLKCGSLNLLEPLGPVQGCNGIVYLYLFNLNVSRIYWVIFRLTVCQEQHYYFLNLRYYDSAINVVFQVSYTVFSHTAYWPEYGTLKSRNMKRGSKYTFIPLSYVKPIASNAASSPLSAIQCFVFQLPLSCSFFNPLNPELNPICCLLALLGANHFLHVSRIKVKSLTLRLLMSYIYMEHPFLMFLDHTQRRTTVGRTPLDE